MSLTQDQRVQLGKREALSIKEKWVVDEAIETLFTYCNAYGVHAAKDDRIAVVEAALIQYIIESRK
jgi:hypothetical protein